MHKDDARTPGVWRGSMAVPYGRGKESMKYKRKDTKGRFGSGRVIRRLLTFLSASLLCLGMTVSVFAGTGPVGQQDLSLSQQESSAEDKEGGKTYSITVS